jgi:hypothetical protein
MAASFARPGRSNSREPGQLSLARNRPASLTKPNWSETSSPGCGPCCRSRPCTHRVAALTLRSVVEDSDSWACAIATAPGIESSRPGQRHRLRGWLSRTNGEAYGARACAPVASPCFPVLHTTHIVRSFPRASVTTLFRTAPTLLTREPLRRWNKATHNMALCVAPLLHCHADCSLTSRKVSAVSAPVRRHRSRQPPLRLEMISRGCLPHARRCGSHPPPNPNARPLPSPRDRRWKLVCSLRSKNPAAVFRSFFAGPRPVALTSRPQHTGAHWAAPSEGHFHP